MISKTPSICVQKKNQVSIQKTLRLCVFASKISVQSQPHKPET